MHISLSPQRRDDTLSLELTAPDRVRINGELFNFGPLAEGDLLPEGVIPCRWIVGPVSRVNGEIHLTLVLPHGASPDAHVAFPVPIIDPPLGIVDLPFSQWRETREDRVEGGIVVTTTTHSWQQADDISVEFIPDPEPELAGDPIEEPSHVEP